MPVFRTSEPSLDQFCYTPSQAARVLGRARSTIYRLIETGNITTRQTVHGPVIMRSEILRYLSEDGDRLSAERTGR